MDRISKDSRFDIFYDGVGYRDHKNLTIREVDDFLCDCEYVLGQKWESIYLPHKNYSEPHVFHIIYTLYLHGYIVCYPNEITRNSSNKQLEGESSLLKEVLNSNYKERQEKERVRDANRAREVEI